MPYQQSMAHAFPKDGAATAHATGYRERAAAAARDLVERLDEKTFNCLNVALNDQDLASVERLAAEWRLRFRDVVIVGIGGSSLGARSLVEPLAGPVPRLHFVDDVGVHSLEPLLRRLDASRSGLLLVSKSGSTAEVLAQSLVALRSFEAALGRERMADHLAAVVTPGANPLRRLVERWGGPLFDHDPDVDGRYSVLTIVGQLPALLAGIDPRSVRSGAREVLTRLRSDPDDHPATLAAAWQVAHEKEAAAATTVVLSYEPRLAPLVQWHRQLWAESLGKGGCGLTPQAALGPVDQHSQLQQWLDGKTDKVFTIVVPEAAGQGASIPTELLVEGLDYLKGRTLGDLVAAEARATIETLAQAERPLRTIRLARTDAATLGALFAHFMVETIVTARLLGVEPFGQPAVEEGKRLTRDYLRQGQIG